MGDNTTKRKAGRQKKESTYLKDREFGKLKVTKDSGQRRGHTVLWECECKCGNKTLVATGSLTSGNTKSCGCGMLENYAKHTHNNPTFVHGTELGWLNIEMKTKSNTSGRRGVSKGKGTRWRARITFQGTVYHLGTKDTFDEAVKLREEAEERLYGNFLKWYKETYGELPETKVSKKKKLSTNKSNK